MKGRITYECYGFEEEHNHFHLRHDDIDLTRKGCQMKVSDQRFVHISNVGATRAHKLHTSLRGGYKYGGPTVVDYQNYKRDYDNFVGRGDAKVLVDLMTKKRDGDLSFDATLWTNRHFMVFVPFTAVDNHNYNVVIGLALVGHEHVPNYKWLLQAFPKAHLKPLLMILTNQCPEIATVFPDSRYRLCIWHIMYKVPNKVQTKLYRAAWTCSIKSVNADEEVDTYLIEHLDIRDEKIEEYKVVRNLKESTIVCSCNHIGRHEYGEATLCRLNYNNRQRICDVGEDQCRIINDTYDVIDDVLDILRDDKEKLESFVATIKDLRDDLAKESTHEPSMKRKERGIEQIVGFPRPDNIKIRPATGIRNKGCGTTKRLIGAAEKEGM
ncbi:MULE transposase domain-containing protein [Cynara cardunculus var. scolymus]|uniref:MULE transposase domain-containing protein n=1 Tax=Cynara cardunculus var. scolymus TaxID=59895 RepID=A0A103TPM9_CYNCS|nr:MULE transposase domain-containing protein [Cynara cardunculus var. scolymus]